MRRLRFLPVAAVLTGLLLAWGLTHLAEGRPVSVINRTPPGVVASATGQHNWRYVRNVNTTGYVEANDAAVTTATMAWANTVNDYVQLEPYENSITLSFFAYGDGSGGGDPSSGTVDVNVYLVEPYGGWEKVASVSLTVGAMLLSHNPVTGAALDGADPNYAWCDGVGTDNLKDPNAWPSQVRLSGRTNGIFRLTLDTMGAQALVVRYDNMTSITRIYGVLKGR
jgi:hypothetical protein